MSMIIFLIVLSILVVVHEWGHFITAKSLGVSVERFSLGFGPKLYSRKHGGTEFMLCAIPLGGYVKLAGDDRTQCKGKPGEFYSHPIWHRALIVLMGPVVNIVFAYLCFYVILVSGFPVLAAKIGKVMDGYPAQVAGLQKDDQILRIDDRKIDSWEDVQGYIVSSKDATLNFHVRREGQELVRQISPKQTVMKNIFGVEASVRVVGIQPKEEVAFLRFGPIESVGKAGEEIWKVTSLTIRSIYHIITGALPAKDALAGPIRIFDVIKNAAHMGLAYLIYTMAVISLSLAIFNLFPIPILDGGHLFLFAIEKVRGSPLPLKVEEGLARVGFSLLMCLMVFVLYNDVVETGWVRNIKGALQHIQQQNAPPPANP